MNDFLPTLWRNSKTNKQEELDAIPRWCADEETITALDRFAYWDSCMRDAFPETIQNLYEKLKFERDREANVASPSGPTDWTFTVYVIRFVLLCLLLPSHTKKSFEARPLSIQLLDDMEEEMIKADGRRTPPPHAERRGRDTPEPDKDPHNKYFWMGGPTVQGMLARLRDFIE